MTAKIKTQIANEMNAKVDEITIISKSDPSQRAGIVVFHLWNAVYIGRLTAKTKQLKKNSIRVDCYN